ncbi:hypothetical protein A1O7_01979 [Cladophialophora yegresii CBS 114405]|uniref:Hsp70-like protein n=1 Tax=Cladophialophora yegresii CBS 114405 TaxID=1182544 RepID=W9WAJ3_9EURO|nr:uncharacterized protein A1O7_01979 [Cladophialophora yegresii CBS 114405]EXJ61551.1 hypothetical protein A1O7_01979 [Cladophialophora yegresii CBS 114405]
MDPDTPMRDSDDTRHFVIAIDFGTTFSSVAYVGYYNASQRPRIGLQQIEIVDRYPYNPYGNFTCHDVPTELWYSQRIPRPIPQSRDTVDRQPAEDDDSPGGNDHQAFSVGSASTGLPESNHPSSILSHPENKKAPLFWGYGVQDQLLEADYNTDHSRHLSRFKLILDKSPHTEKVRNGLSKSCSILKKMLLINEDTDLIADYLAQLLQHTKTRLIDSEGYTDASTVEFVLCVPAVWKAEAIRQMQIALTAAIANTCLGKLQHGTIDNLFIVSEPEGAAACVLAREKTRLKIGDTFMLLGAGGGTVDAITYTVDKDFPLRLKTEEVEPGGKMIGSTCGSSFINERYEDLLRERLKNATYLEDNGESLPTIISGLVVEFERRDKKRLDAKFLDPRANYTVKVQGLKHSDKLRFEKGRLVLNRKEMEVLFLPSLEGVAEIMKEQLRLAREKGCDVKKIILMGGFGQSESLCDHLRKSLATECGPWARTIVFETSKLPSTAVARGAVLRALRKEDGPARVLQASYGFIRTERYGTQAEHLGQVPITDKIDGREYIDNTIEWIIKKGDTVESEYIIPREVEYTFAISRRKLVGAEYLYVSDRRHEDHYRRESPENEGAIQAGYVEIDMTSLKTSGLIKPQPVPGKLPCWRIKGTLNIIVSGRNLRYEIKLPGDIAKVGQSSIAAAFRPGTE